MKEIKLSQQGKNKSLNLVAFVDDEDFHFVNKLRWFVSYARGSFYAVTKIEQKNVKMHRFILGVTDRSILIDHRDGNTFNNQRSNIRTATPSQNQANRSVVRGASGFLGVHFDKESNKWQAAIRKNKKGINLGRFNSEVDAAVAYNKAATEIHGEFARLNNIPEPINQ